MIVSELTESNVLSLWLGGVTNFSELDEYIWANFELDFGIKFEERTAPEIDAQDAAIPIKDLLDGFSFSDQWIDTAICTCERAGWHRANCAVILFNVRYPPKLVERTQPSSLVKFVGNIEWKA